MVFKYFSQSLWLYLTHRQKLNLLFLLKKLPTGGNDGFWLKMLLFMVKNVFQKVVYSAEFVRNPGNFDVCLCLK